MTRPPIPLDLGPLRTRLLDEHDVDAAARVAAITETGSDLDGELRTRVGGSLLTFRPDGIAGGLGVEDAITDVVVAELLFMWLQDKEGAVDEIHRVLRPGGVALLTAEPDYNGAMEHPPEAGVHGLVAGVIRKQGADPEAGRRLRDLFGPDRWKTDLFIHPPDPSPGPAGAELEALVRDVRAVIGDGVDAAVIDRWERELRKASDEGKLLLYVPCFALAARKST